MRIKIRKAKVGDSKKIARVVYESFLKTARGDCSKREFENYLNCNLSDKSEEQLFGQYFEDRFCFVAVSFSGVLKILLG